MDVRVRRVDLQAAPAVSHPDVCAACRLEQRVAGSVVPCPVGQLDPAHGPLLVGANDGRLRHLRRRWRGLPLLRERWRRQQKCCAHHRPPRPALNPQSMCRRWPCNREEHKRDARRQRRHSVRYYHYYRSGLHVRPHSACISRHFQTRVSKYSFGELSRLFRLVLKLSLTLHALRGSAGRPATSQSFTIRAPRRDT